MREQLLAARNLVMGTTNILLLAVPDGWRVLEGPSQPEIDRWSERADQRWMSEGRATYRLVAVAPEAPEFARAEVELRLTATPSAPDVHDVRHRFTTVRRGLLPRREVPAAEVEIDCPFTGRRLRLELSPAMRGNRPTARPEDLQRLVHTMLEGLRCH
ncbi:hypothetical protein [Symbiobacterium thermophilum]|uniref:Uncharacterized protein n=1 Tax=Symbiobacterium thermophilum (strain DSM 24528 / JCM 14929 / IAM 14863 / T) TaxID=292459 RepID=Q67RM9_SYMTH|nr:hypothetical protein [Symbiobacterium thermophilum]BAD39664.1 hypothetical protein STH679 [Symbiobacterium thermophilum IAM 14863]